jgi:hypothetical protein
MVKVILQSSDLLHKVAKGYYVDGIQQICGACKGKGCTSCGKEGKIFRMFLTLTAMQDEYLAEGEFTEQLQNICIGKMNKVLLVDEPDFHAQKEVDSGVPVVVGGTDVELISHEYNL